MKHVPAWSGDGISRHLGLNRILFSDPSVILSTDLRLGWHGGDTQQLQLQEDLAQLLAGIVAGSRPLPFGPFGGGFAALPQGAIFRGSTVAVSNPQTDVSLFTKIAVDRYMHTAWGQTELHPAWAPFISEVMSLYERPVDAKVVYVQNAGDADPVEKHYSRFRDFSRPDNKVVYLMPNLGPGHLGPDRDSFVKLLATVRDNTEWDSLTSAVRGLEIPGTFDASAVGLCST